MKRGGRIIAAKVLSLPRGVSKITLSPVSVTGERTALIVRTGDERGADSDIYSEPFIKL